MATLYVEFVRLVKDDNSFAIDFRNEVASEAVTISASNAQTTGTASRDKPYARISCDAACYVTVGANPNASTSTTSRIRLASGAGVYVLCDPSDKVAAITI